ncbi:hypothetical protein [Dysgonomonas sp. 520]|uniref:hypothetical protein n=1 Tax=Dysgonomonas sp. 520 TaxID=2302931 RepID=UPI0013D11033|nr:hypothetical protein [Dysgonomonas sp. 520]NDW10986.1 hypothetical protein [Dysgonomonas sp. 520]
MKVTNTVITKQASAETSNGKYQIEYTVSGNTLVRVLASISGFPDENQNELYIGNISYDNGQITCSLPNHIKTSLFFEDFEGFMVMIKTDVEALIQKK